jgi:hypothetical protein
MQMEYDECGQPLTPFFFLYFLLFSNVWIKEDFINQDRYIEQIQKS